LEDINIDKNDNYSFSKIFFCFIVPYCIIYIFAGFISLLPIKIMNEKNKKKEEIKRLKIFIFNNLCVSGITAKNFFNFYLLNTIIEFFKFCFSIPYIIFFEMIIFLLFSLIDLFFLFSFKNKKDKKYDKDNSLKNNNNQQNNENNNKVDKNVNTEMNFCVSFYHLSPKNLYISSETNLNNFKIIINYIKV